MSSAICWAGIAWHREEQKALPAGGFWRSRAATLAGPSLPSANQRKVSLWQVRKTDASPETAITGHRQPRRHCFRYRLHPGCHSHLPAAVAICQQIATAIITGVLFTLVMVLVVRSLAWCQHSRIVVISAHYMLDSAFTLRDSNLALQLCVHAGQLQWEQESA